MELKERNKQSEILIADSSNVIRANLKKLISASHKSVVIYEAEDITSIHHLLLSIEPDVLILEIFFADGNAFDLLYYMRKKAMCPTVIIYTDYYSSFNREKCKKMGVDYYFNKLNDHEKVLGVIDKKIVEDKNILGG